MKRLLSILLTITLLAGLTAFPISAGAASEYATVEGGWLRLRDGASFNAYTVSSYNVGTIVEILGTNGDWYKVKTPDGTVGYMYSKYLARGGSYYDDTTYPYTGKTNATIISANGYGVRLRSGPSTSYRIIRKYPVHPDAGPGLLLVPHPGEREHGLYDEPLPVQGRRREPAPSLL